MRNGARCLVAALVFAVGLLAPRVAWGQAVTAGYDLLETDPGTTFTDLSIPGGTLFGPGSDPVSERVFLRGNPIDSFDPDGIGGNPPFGGLLPTDTIVRRTAIAGPVYPDTIPIEIVALHLVSVQPIVVTGVGPGFPQTWNVSVDIDVDGAGNVQPPQVLGTMTLRHEGPNGGTFDSQLPVQAQLTFTRVDAPGFQGPVPAPPITLAGRNAPWCHQANPLGTPMGYLVLDVLGLTTNFFASVFCADTLPPERLAVSYSVDGGVFNAARNGLPLTPSPNPAEGLFMPPPPHVPPNDVYALGTAPGANGYATEGEVFQSAGAPLGAPPNTTNVDRMSAALGVGPVPAGPPFLGPFAPNPGAPAPGPPPPGVVGPPGSFGPPPGNTVGVLGLVPDDNIDALSYGRDSGNVLLFSVDPATVGVPFSAVNSQAVLSPFGGAAGLPFPTNPGGGDPGDEAAGDIFKSVQLLNFGSYIGLHFAAGAFIAPAVFFPNQLEIDEIDLGLQAPALNGTSLGPPEDDLDGLEMADTGDIVFGVDIEAPFAPGPDGIPDRWTFFSIDTASPTVAAGLALPFLVTPDDILVTPPGGFSFSVYADGAAHIGLLPGDDLESLALSDVLTLGALDPGFDEALFSFHPGSPMVLTGCDGVPGSGDEVSPADIFYTNFTVPFCLIPPPPYASAAVLGLLSTDNVNAIDILPAQLYPRPVRPPIPPPCPCKKLTPEQAMLAKHGIRVAEKRRDQMHSVAQIDINTVVFGPVSAIVSNPPLTPMVANREAELFHPGTAVWQVPVEIVSLDLQGTFFPPGQPISVRAGRQFGLRPTNGTTTGVDPGYLFPAESFFDVFVEIDLPTFGVRLHNNDPVPVRASGVRQLPPFGDEFRYRANPPVDPGIEVFDQNDNFAGHIVRVGHIPQCQSDAECADACDPCNQRTCDIPTGRCLQAPLPDTDGDGVCDDADNCPQLPNPGGQSLVTFGQTIKATSASDFCWPAPADINWVQGDLAAVDTYGFNSVTPDTAVTCFTDPTMPGSGAGLYYLVKPGCLAGSYQNDLGSEPGRDRALP